VEPRSENIAYTSKDVSRGSCRTIVPPNNLTQLTGLTSPDHNKILTAMRNARAVVPFTFQLDHATTTSLPYEQLHNTIITTSHICWQIPTSLEHALKPWHSLGSDTTFLSAAVTSMGSTSSDSLLSLAPALYPCVHMFRPVHVPGVPRRCLSCISTPLGPKQ
jgi:hypothetical protein